ncbi:MAG: hypothetical protein H7A24_12150 [Leptospiraceae bacterium]|nr:hypothetical protein [Leptospiraceae bacterium]MCP5512626.1 hypothetical protein [Leptospiraceae bacterium]
MINEEMDPNLRCSFSRNKSSLANVVGETQMGRFGLEVEELLNTSQYRNLMNIKNKKLGKKNLDKLYK